MIENRPLPTTFIDLFAGIGGMRIACENNGWKCVFSSEIDEYCRTMYYENFGEMPIGDIAQVSAHDIPDHDILVAGFPCQPFSIIGDRMGLQDTRGTLFFEIERILKEKRPKGFLLENVKQLRSHDGGRTFKTISERLDELGYYIHYKILNGLDFGVPQKRERLVIVGFKENHPFTFPDKGPGPSLTLEELLEPEENVPRKFYISPYMQQRLEEKVKFIPCRPSVWHENKSGNIGIHPFSCALRASASYNYLLVNGERRLTPREMLRLQGFPDSFRIAVPDGQLRKQAGNSVVIPKIQAVVKAMDESLKMTPVKITIQSQLGKNDNEAEHVG